MIEKIENVFFLNTARSSYLLRVHPSGVLEHLYYGKILKPTAHTAALWGRSAFAPGNTIVLEKEFENLSLEELRMEYSSTGKGDIREPMVEAELSDGSRTLDFRYADYEIRKGKTAPETLPGCTGDEKTCSELRIRLRDRKTKETYSGLEMTLVYDVYEDTDVIVRRSILSNHSTEPVRVGRLLSSQIDFPGQEMILHTFGGPWTAEMQHFTQEIQHGKFINSSCCGISSNRNNPFTMLSAPETTETHGDCYGFHLVYSGNHYTCAERSSFGDVRIVTGINPNGFSWKLLPEKTLEAPEAVMAYSGEGFTGMSHVLHYFIRNHVVRGKWKNRVRPILLNSWEASYFKITESGLVRMAKAAKEAGVELFVMDDGWFQGRKDDKSSLGDWTADSRKLPQGLKGISDKIHAQGLLFGLWVEPEMISENSDLYRAHPDWAMSIPGRDHSLGRNQMLLDLTQIEVRKYVTESMRKVFSSAKIEYVKWDMNRIFSDVFSAKFSADRQGEIAHRYILGLYEIMETLTREFPDILFEGCASGGARFDLGILSYFPQIWASDDTDAYARAGIQNSYSFGYPPSVYGAHVSGVPNHQTLRSTSLEARFSHAAFGVLGYECNLAELPGEEKKKVKEQIAFYKKYRRIFQFGTFYRLTNQDGYQWLCVSEDRKTAIGMYMKGLAQPNRRKAVFRAAGLEPEQLYHFTNLRTKLDIREFGSLVNTMAAIHIRQDSLMHKALSAVVKMDNEKEDLLVPGDQLMNAGVVLKEAYSGVGYSEAVRLARDFETRMYLLEAVE